jgi:hypothetical protein
MELKVNRRNTKAFIEIKPTVIDLQPQRKVRTPTGGFDIANDQPRGPQTFRIIDLTGDYLVNQPPQRTIDGIERAVEFELIGNWDAQLALFDTWTDAAGERWEITAVHPDNGYERRALAVRYAD